MIKSAISRIFPVVALIALFLAPSQHCVSLAGVRVTPADVLLPFAFAMAFLIGGMRALVPALESAIFLAMAAISAAFGVDKAEGVKELVQLTLYFYVAERIASCAFSTFREKGVAYSAMTFLAAGGITIAIAAAQYFLPDATTFPLCLRPGLSVRGAFSNNNVLGGYLALLLPFAFALALSGKCMKSCGDSKCPAARGPRICIVCKAILCAMTLVGLFVVFSGAAFAAIGAALSVIAFRRRSLAGAACAMAIAIAFLYVMPMLPRDNFTSIVQSTEIYHSDSGSVRYSDDGVLTWNAGDPTRRYPEWQAALTMSFERPLVGIGPGSYQSNVGPYFDMIPRATGPCEPDIQNMYLVLVSTMGYPALIAFLLMLCSAVRKGLEGDAVATAAAIAIVTFAVTAIWHPLLVRGIGIPLAFMLSLASRKRASD